MSGVIKRAERRAREQVARAEQLAELFSAGEQWSELFEQLTTTDVTDPTSAEQLRLEYCEVCTDTAKLPAEARDALCQHRRCGLRDQATLEAEQQWAARMMDTLVPAALADRAAVDDFNDYIALACITPAAVVLGNGRLGAGQQIRTLRAAIHYGILQAVVTSDGDTVRLHAAEVSGDEAKALVLQARLAQKRRDQALAQQLWEQQWPKTKIAARLGSTPRRERGCYSGRSAEIGPQIGWFSAFFRSRIGKSCVPGTRYL
jgi:hypothetical protein